MINSLQTLRGLFAILIFLSHFSINPATNERAFYTGGVMGVEFFIVLSGFVLCAGYEKSLETDRVSYGNFMMRRMVRIYPMHLACLSAWVVVMFGNVVYNPFSIGANLLLVQAWVPDIYVFYGCNTPSWCLSCFLFFYLLFPWLTVRYEKSRRAFLTVYLAILLSYISFLAFSPEMSESMETWVTRVLPTTRLLDFILGMLLWHLYSSLARRGIHTRLQRLPGWGKTLLELIPVGMYIYLGFTAEDVSLRWQSQAIWWIPAMTCVMVFALMDKEGGLFSRLFNLRLPVAFGNASFCFYLMHVPAMNIIRRLLHFLRIEMDPVALLPLTLLVTVVASMIVSRYIDNPLGRRLRTILAR